MKAGVWALAVLAGLCLGSGAHAAPIYTMTVLDRLQGLHSVAKDINAQGQVVGYAQTQAGTYIAALWANGAVTSLDDWSAGQAGSNSQAYAINDQGAIAGYSTVNGRRHAALWANGGFTDLDPFGASSIAFDIDAQGRAVGRSGNEAASFAAGAVTTLANGRSSSALGLNQAGAIVGNALDNFDRAATFQNGSFAYLANPGVTSTAHAVNDAGQIVGEGQNCYGLLRCALSWGGGSPSHLGTLGGSAAAAYDINGSGVVVGVSDTVNNAQHAFVWQGGVMSDLNALIADLGDWIVFDAVAINDRGQIVGEAYDTVNRTYRPVVLSLQPDPMPVPQPATIWLVCAGLLAWLGLGKTTRGR